MAEKKLTGFGITSFMWKTARDRMVDLYQRLKELEDFLVAHGKYLSNSAKKKYLLAIRNISKKAEELKKRVDKMIQHYRKFETAKKYKKSIDHYYKRIKSKVKTIRSRI